jgi:hypothetical protein
MKSNEIMIGDWVAFRGHPYQYTANDIAAMAECEAKNIPTDTTEIPLTKDILKKNGFVSTPFDSKLVVANANDHYQVRWDGCMVMARRLGGGEIFVKCKYVHEIQHVMRLCGIEKEIKL